MSGSLHAGLLITSAINEVVVVQTTGSSLGVALMIVTVGTAALISGSIYRC